MLKSAHRLTILSGKKNDVSEQFLEPFIDNYEQLWEEFAEWR